MNSWTKINGEWAVRTKSGNTGDLVTVAANSGKISKVRLGAQIVPGIFEIFKNANAVAKTPKPISETDVNGFEVTSCHRCGGSGHYSYCQMYGTICFECGGRKKKYTERGFAAHKMFTDSLEIPASEFQPGMLIRDDITKKWHKVLSVKIDGTNCTLDCEKFARTCAIDCKVRRNWSVPEKQEKLKVALEYQKTL